MTILSSTLIIYLIYQIVYITRDAFFIVLYFFYFIFWFIMLYYYIIMPNYILLICFFIIFFISILVTLVERKVLIKVFNQIWVWLYILKSKKSNFWLYFLWNSDRSSYCKCCRSFPSPPTPPPTAIDGIFNGVAYISGIAYGHPYILIGGVVIGRYYRHFRLFGCQKKKTMATAAKRRVLVIMSLVSKC